MSLSAIARPLTTESRHDVPSAISLLGVSMSFGSVRALADLTLDIPAGTTVALLGPNGAGKSTAIDIMLGLLRPDAGDARTLGMAPDRAVAGGYVGAMLQTGSLPVGATVRELVLFARGLYPAPMPADAVVAHAGLGPILGRTVDALSGGEAQRVRFAIAIAGDPALVFLDEPTVGMDVESRRAFWETMRGFAANGRTILFATHYLDEADHAADRIVVLAAGTIRADGTAAALKAAIGGRVIRFALDDGGADQLDQLGRLPGVTRVERGTHGFALHSDDPDAALRALVLAFPSAHGLEVETTRLEDAFIALSNRSGATTTVEVPA